MPEWKPPSVTVAAVIERDRRFLLVEEKHDGRLVLNQPAGHLDPGESLEAACVREVLEETAHHFRPAGLVGIYRYVYTPRDITFLRFTFHGTAAEFDAGRELDSEIVRTLWLTRDEIAAAVERHRTPLVMACIDDYLAGRRYPLEVLSRAFA